MKIRNQKTDGDKIELQMTPMIDIVFQLLVFFIMTFKIAALEGDFNIKMPANAPSEGPPDPDENIVLRVQMRDANGDGILDPGTFRVNEKRLTYRVVKRPTTGAEVVEMPELTFFVVQTLNPSGASDTPEPTEVELDCDPSLKYEYVIAAITAVSGYKDNEENLIKLVEKIRFKDNSGS